MSQASLKQRVEQELTELSAVVVEVQRVVQKYQHSQDADILPAIAMNLQSYYTGTERIMVSIALHCDREVPEGKDWHRKLLEQMGHAVPNQRSALISETVMPNLDELRRFRHVVRSIYAFKLDPDLLLPIAQQLLQGHQQLEKDCTAFLEQFGV